MASGWERLEEREDPEISAEERSRFLGVWHEDRRMFGYTLLAELPYALRSALHDHGDLHGVDHDLLIIDEYQDPECMRPRSDFDALSSGMLDRCCRGR